MLPRRFVRFAAVGASGVGVNLGALLLLSEVFGLGDNLSSALAIELSILSNFLLNNAWTFKDQNAGAASSFVKRALLYNGVSLVGLGIQLGCFISLNALVVRFLDLSQPGAFKYLAQLAGIALAMGWNYLSNFHFTWRQRKVAPDLDAQD